MKIRSIELLETTKEFYLMKIIFEESSLFGGRKITSRKCFAKKSGYSTNYLDTGDAIDTGLWDIVRAFLDTGKESITTQI